MSKPKAKVRRVKAWGYFRDRKIRHLTTSKAVADEWRAQKLWGHEVFTGWFTYTLPTPPRKARRK